MSFNKLYEKSPTNLLNCQFSSWAKANPDAPQGPLLGSCEVFLFT